MSSAMSGLMLEPREFRILEGMRLVPKRNFAGRARGERLTKRKGISIEYSDYRDYSDGDDLRHLDWNVLARLETPVIKTYQDEEDLSVYLLIDTSASMGFGIPSKLESCVKIAAAIGYVGLCSLDAVEPRVLGARKAPVSTMRGRSNFSKLIGFLSSLSPLGERSISESVGDFARSGSKPGLVFLLTDGLDQNMGQALRILNGRRHEVCLIQVLCPEELDPDLEGDLKLIDVESGSTVEITANSQAINAYRNNLTRHCDVLRAEALKIGGRYARVSSCASLEDVVSGVMRREGWMSS